MPLETEIKLRLRDGAVARVEALGFTVHTPRQLESDQLYDRTDGALSAARQVLRLRTRGERVTLTYKGPPEPGPHKRREEIELDVSNGTALALVLERLGYQPSFRYEKYRTTYASKDQTGIITLDETPVGSFLELEGPAEWIDTTSALLGYSAKDYIVESYASLWRKHCKLDPNAVPSAMLF